MRKRVLLPSVIGEGTHYCGEYSSGATFHSTFTGLQPETTYYYYASAENSAGSSQGETRSFTTAPEPCDPPDLCCLKVVDIGSTWVILQANLTDDGGEDCTCTLSILGGETWTEPGTYRAPHTFSHNFTGLTPSTNYQGNAEVENSCGGATMMTQFTTEEQTTFPIQYQNHQIDDDYNGNSFGNNNSKVEGGETIELTITLQNNGDEIINNVTATLTTSDNQIDILDDYAVYGAIPPGGTASGEYLFEVDIDHEDGDVEFALNIHGDGIGDDTDTFTIHIYENTGLNYAYIKDKVYQLSRIILDVYNDTELAKGRAFGTKGEWAAADDIESWMNSLDYFDKVMQVPLSGDRAKKLEVVDRGLMINDGSGYKPVECYISPAWAVPPDQPWDDIPPSGNYSYWDDNELVVKPSIYSYDDAFREFLEYLMNNTGIVISIAENSTNYADFAEQMREVFEDYFDFSFEELDPNDNSTWPSFYNESSPQPQGRDYVIIEEDPWNNPDVRFPLADAMVNAGCDPFSDAVIFTKFLNLTVRMWGRWICSRISLGAKCRGWILYDFNDHTHNMINADGMPFPIIFINGTVGRMINSSVDSYTIRFYINQNWNKTVESYNVIGQINGSDPSRTVIISSLYDSWWNQGTADSAIGIGIMLGVAEWFKRHNVTPFYNVKFIAFSGEEKGYLGARDYFENHSTDNIFCVIDLNQLGFRERIADLTFDIITNSDTVRSEVESMALPSHYSERTGTGFETHATLKGGPSNNNPFYRTSPTVLFLKNTGWTLHHRDGRKNGVGDPHTEGDVFDYYDDWDVYVTGEMILNVTKNFTLNPPLIKWLAWYPFKFDLGDIVKGDVISRTFEIWNSGRGTLYYSLSEPYSWVTVTPTSGSSTGEHDIITVTIDTSSLTAGSHYCKISISSNGANFNNGEGCVWFKFKVIEPTPYPILAYDPSYHDFGSMEAGETDTTTFEIWNNGSGTLDYTLSENEEWVTVTPMSGSSTGEHDTITVDIDTTGLTPGVHICDISISSNGGDGSFRVKVTVTGEEQLDQHQEECLRDLHVFDVFRFAQSFKPTLSQLSRIELYLARLGDPPSDLIVEIRNGSATGPVLRGVIIQPSYIDTSYSWVDINIPDVTLNPGSDYYIELRTSGGDKENCYLWGYTYYDRYSDGSLWYSKDGGVVWYESSWDACFRTYGYGSSGGGNTPPVANDDTADTLEDTPIWIPVLENDYDPDGSLDPSSVTVISGPSHGTTTVNTSTGEIRYTPDSDYYGSDSFVYRVSDDSGGSDTALVSVSITPVSDPPVAVDDSASTSVDTPVWIHVLENDYDPDGDIDPGSVIVISEPPHGTTTVNTSTGEIRYTPDSGFIGIDSFVYSVSDSGGLSDSAMVSVDISGGEQLDQYQESFSGGVEVYSSRWMAQSFTPSLGTLTRLELYLSKSGSPPSDLFVEVRDGSASGPVVTSTVVSSSMVDTSYSWVSVDVPDAAVSPGSVYFIVVHATGGSSYDTYRWGYSRYDSYSGGVLWYSPSGGAQWYSYPAYDFCFRTYGR